MADEQDEPNSTDDEQTGTGEPTEPPTSGSEREQDASGSDDALDDKGGMEDDSADAGDADEDDGESRSWQQERVTFSASNAAVVGQMLLHYEARDVAVWLDGDAAVRLMAMFRDRREGIYGDKINVFRSDANNAFVMLDLYDPPLAMSWVPGLPRLKPRTAIDPAVTAD